MTRNVFTDGYSNEDARESDIPGGSSLKASYRKAITQSVYTGFLPPWKFKSGTHFTFCDGITEAT